MDAVEEVDQKRAIAPIWSSKTLSPLTQFMFSRVFRGLISRMVIHAADRMGLPEKPVNTNNCVCVRGALCLLLYSVPLVFSPRRGDWGSVNRAKDTW